MNRMAEQDLSTAPEPLLSPAGVLAFPARPLPVGSPVEDILAGLYAAWFGQLVEYAREFVSADEAEDVVQQSFIEVWERYLKSGLQPRVPFETVLFAAIRFRVFDYRRTTKRRRFLAGRFFYVDELLDAARKWMRPDASDDAASLTMVIAKALKRLPPRTREVQVLHRRSGLDSNAIARLTGLSPSTVRVLLCRGTSVIREHLERAGYGPAARRKGTEGEPQ